MTTVGRWSPNKVRARVLDGTWVSAEELGGMVLLTPTSIAYTGTSASIGTNGSVEFTACSSLSLNGVFSADYDNYMMVMRQDSSSALNIGGRLRSGSTDTITGYFYQNLFAGSTTVSANRYNTAQWNVTDAYATQRSGATIYVYRPYLSQTTAFRTAAVVDYQEASLHEHSGTEITSTSYDGFTFFSSNSFTGVVSVYGLVGA
jgi:hypothetical protein